MRGKAGDLVHVETESGITPAYAGKSLTILILYTDRWDHPRVCGEKKPQIFADEGFRGSPPRMRGKDNHRSYESLTIGITPAYAGKREFQLDFM